MDADIEVRLCEVEEGCDSILSVEEIYETYNLEILETS